MIFKQNAPENSVIVLHGCAHNPSGMDLTIAQWRSLSVLFKVRNRKLDSHKFQD
jgi:aspartate/tyrosine/aromatic aminotransferase